MTTKTEVANLALLKIGQTTIRNIDDPNLPEARNVKMIYAQARDEALRACFWSFAMRAQALGPETVTPQLTAELDGWENAFLLPAGFLKLEKVTVDGVKLDRFRMQRITAGRAILCNASAITLHYVVQIDTPADYDPLFTAALVTLLASKLARSISGSEQLETTFKQTYEQVDLPAARTADGHDNASNENHPLQEILDGALTGRRTGLLEEPIFITLPT
jgi:hypothetical protein